MQCISGRQPILPLSYLVDKKVVASAWAVVVTSGVRLIEGEIKDYDHQKTPGILLRMECGHICVLSAFWADKFDTLDPDCPLYCRLNADSERCANKNEDRRWVDGE